MTQQDINKRFTEIVSDYLQRGYYFNTSTMADSQCELASVDLTDGKEIIRILSKNFHEQSGNRYYLDGIRILIGRTPGCITPSSSRGGVIWNNDLEIICMVGEKLL